jgi:tellurite methyltransferase
VERAITGYRRDAEGEWVAELGCGHDQHVRHRPPFQPREWILTEGGRDGRLGTPLPCPLCDRAEPPSWLRPVRSSPEWTEQTAPSGLRRRHRLGNGTWGLLVVHEGRLRCTIATAPPIDVVVTPAKTQALPPEVDHAVTPEGSVRFSVRFFAVDRSGGRATGVDVEEGGDPACWSGLLCLECGAVSGPEDHHRPGCPMGATAGEAG